MANHFPLCILLLLWAGVILGVSFHAWTKFKTPSLTKAVGLDIGRTVFRAFHRMQWVLLAFLSLGVLVTTNSKSHFIIPVTIGILLCMQTFWILPQLYATVDNYLAKIEPSKSYYHHLFSLIEMTKLFLLIGGSICLMRT